MFSRFLTTLRRSQNGPAKPSAKRRSRLHVETLEPRMLLDAEGVLTGLDAYYTLSFAPDDTEIAGHTYCECNVFSVWCATRLAEHDPRSVPDLGDAYQCRYWPRER